MRKNYYTIREISAMTEIPQHTLRYWEEKFRLFKPLRLSSGHRRYTPKDIEIINKVKDLVFIKGYSLSGARKILNSRKNTQEIPYNNLTEQSNNKNNLALKIISEIRKELDEILLEIEKLEK